MQELPDRKVEFTEEIERQAIRIILQDHNFAVKWKGRMKPEHFNLPHIQQIFRAVDTFTSSFTGLPTYAALYQELNKILTIDDDRDGFYKYIHELLHEPDRNNGDYVKKALLDHMEANDYDTFLVQSARLIRDGKYKEVPQLLSDLTIRHTSSEPTIAYLSSELDSVSARVNEEVKQRPAVATPWITLNNNHGGGFHPSAVAAFMGSTGVGKSICLINAGAHYLKMGKTVYHFTFELSAKKTKARYDVCLTGCSYAERQAKPGILDESLNKLKAHGLGKLYVIQLPTGTCSAKMVQAVINDHVLLGAPKPDILILDYLTIMAPNNVEHVDMKREYAVLKKVAEEVRALAMGIDIPILTALQSNRGAANKESQSKEDIADSYAVMAVLDVVLSINQSVAEKQVAKLRFFIAKCRDFADGYTIMCDVDYSNLRIKEDVVTTVKYHDAINRKREDAISQLSNAGIHAPIHAAVTDPSSLGLEVICGLGKNTIRSSVVQMKPLPP